MTIAANGNIGIGLNNPTKKSESVFSNTYQPTNIILRKKQE